MLWVQLVASAKKQSKTKTKKWKILFCTERMQTNKVAENIKKTGIGPTKVKYFAFLDEESSCSDDNSSPSEEKDPHVRAKQVVATYLNEGKCKSKVRVVSVDASAPEITRTCSNGFEISWNTHNFTRQLAWVQSGKKPGKWEWNSFKFGKWTYCLQNVT